MAKTLGERIRELRDQADLSLREFGRRLGGKSAAFLSDIELGRRFPSEGLLERIAKELGVTVEHLREFDQRPPVTEMKQLIEQQPTYGLAFRRVVGANPSPEDLIEFAKRLEKKREREDK